MKMERKNDNPESPQPLIGFMTNEEWEQLLAYVNTLVQEMEQLPLPEVRSKVFDLLMGIDRIHREALRRLTRLFKEGVMEQVVTDPAIHSLMELYDLLPPGYAGRGEDSPRQPGELPFIPIRAVPMERQAPAPRSAAHPNWVPVLKGRDELAPGTTVEIQADEQAILLCRVADTYFAMASRCPRDNASLEQATLHHYTLICPHHPGCYYDVRQGTRIAGVGRIDCYPVKRQDDGAVLVGLNMDFRPELPTF